MVLMFQKEVAERIVAAPSTKAYGRLAVLAQWRTRPRLLFTLNPEAFTPPPAVDVGGGRVPAYRTAATGVLSPLPRKAHRGSIRPTPQDAAPKPEISGSRTRSDPERGRPRCDFAR